MKNKIEFSLEAYIEFRVLRYFLAVAHEGNISKAADFLNVTQPTLSRQLIDLEYELKTKLFIRGKRKLILTEAGILLRKRAEEILELQSKTESEIKIATDIVSGNIFIGGGETDGMRYIAKITHDLQRNYPDIRINLFSGDDEVIIERLDKGLIDFGVFVGVVDITKYDSLQLPATDSWGVLMRKDSPLVKQKSIKPKDLWDKPIIGSRQSIENGELNGWLKRGFDKLNLVATYNLVYNATLMVEEGLGYAITIDKLVNTSGNSILTFIPLEPKLKANLYIAWKKGQVFSKASALFLEKLNSIYEE